MHSPPSAMVRQTQALASLIRSSNKGMGSNESNACRYSEFIRDNVLGVLHNTFPLFSQQVSHRQLQTLVDEFVVAHDASEPEFHQIATEFVSFIQHATDSINTSSLNACQELTSDQLAVLEFEWCAYCVEIDSTPQPLPLTCVGDLLAAEQQQKQGLVTNKTMRLVQVPFIVHGKDSLTFLTKRRRPIFYAMYRDSDLRINTLKLREIDVAIIQMIQQQPNQSLANIKQIIAQQLARFEFINWVVHFSEIELIGVHSLGEKL
ncbi:putative DNA-binding domain-containing protein [Vibrio sp. D404a]|uniref:HvfC/BufC family peptide modification chaperone n=1 Tax=unclassified Vibrio TaxID=2614977 RepID=UPI0025578556|nr:MULTISPECIES: putative DNA-binding domain-containing protein [unclassified Vibrio]MDK9735838.1 putative DNA-binding domain-containing protein [Vibrio sp. D404a]MDK9796702.1 putative DNA-binding domain-containing protein [Vibrio sp. D449a]